MSASVISRRRRSAGRLATRVGAFACAVSVLVGCGASIAAIDLQSAIDDANAAVQRAAVSASGAQEYALAQRLLEEAARQQDGGDAWASYYLAVRAAYTADLAAVVARDETARRELGRLRQDALEARLRAAQLAAETSDTRRVIAETIQARAEADAVASRQEADRANDHSTQIDRDARVAIEKGKAEAELAKAQFLMGLAADADAATHDADGFGRAQSVLAEAKALLSSGDYGAARLRAIEAHRAADDTRLTARAKRGSQETRTTDTRLKEAVDAAGALGAASAAVDRARDAEAAAHAPVEFAEATNALAKAEQAHAAGSYPEASRLAAAAGEAAARAIIAGEGAQERDSTARRREEQEAMVKDAVLRVRRSGDSLDALTLRLSPTDLKTARTYADLAEAALADENLDLAVVNADRAHGLMDQVERRATDAKAVEADLVEKAKDLKNTQAFTARRGVVLRVSGDMFDVGKTELRRDAYPAVAKVAAALRSAVDAYSIVVEGHTDKSGDADANVKLSQQRAAAFMKLLTQYLGAPNADVKSVGYGARQLIAGVPVADPRNRRIEIVVLTRKSL